MQIPLSGGGKCWYWYIDWHAHILEWSLKCSYQTLYICNGCRLFYNLTINLSCKMTETWQTYRDIIPKNLFLHYKVLKKEFSYCCISGNDTNISVAGQQAKENVICYARQISQFCMFSWAESRLHYQLIGINWFKVYFSRKLLRDWKLLKIKASHVCDGSC